MALAYWLIVAYCVFCRWVFSKQIIIRRRPEYSLLLLFVVFSICSLMQKTDIKDLEKGCRIVSGVVAGKHALKGKKCITSYRTTVEYESRSDAPKVTDIKGETVHGNTVAGQQIIIAEPFSRPGDFSALESEHDSSNHAPKFLEEAGDFVALECKPSERLVEKMRHGIYANVNLYGLDNVEDNKQARADFMNFGLQPA